MKGERIQAVCFCSDSEGFQMLFIFVECMNIVNLLFQKGRFFLFWGEGQKINVNLSNEKRAPGCPALCRGWKLPRYVENLKNHSKNPY